MRQEIQDKRRKIKFKEIFVKRYYRVTDKTNQIIKTRAIEKNLSRAKIASLAGVSENYTDHLVRNDRNFREDKLQKILPFLFIEFPSKDFIPQDTIHGKFITLPEKSSPELMQILGYFLGDGTAQPKTVRFKDTDKEVLKVYQDLIRKVFNITGRIVLQTNTKAYLLEVNSVYLSKWLKANIILRKKEFLKEVSQLSKKELVAFLRGLFDAEGFVATQSRQIRLGLTNKEIGRILPILVSKLGIASSFYQIKRKEPNWSDVYLISLNNYAAFENFSKIIGFSSEEKVKKLRFLIRKRVGRKIN